MRFSSNDFFRLFFSELERLDIPYVILHSYEGFPKHIVSDVDYAVRTSDLSKLASIQAGLAERHGWRLAQAIEAHIYALYTVLIDPEEPSAFDAAIEGMGWADTWAGLLGTVRGLISYYCHHVDALPDAGTDQTEDEKPWPGLPTPGLHLVTVEDMNTCVRCGKFTGRADCPGDTAPEGADERNGHG